MGRTKEEMGNILLKLYYPEHVITAIDALEVVEERLFLRTKYGFKDGKQLTTDETAAALDIDKRYARRLERKAIQNLSDHYFPLVCLDALLQDRHGLHEAAKTLERQIIRPAYGNSDLANKLVDACRNAIRRPEERQTVPEYKLEGMASLLYRLFENNVGSELGRMSRAQATALQNGTMKEDIKNSIAQFLLELRLGHEMDPITQVSFHTRVRQFSSDVKRYIGTTNAYREMMQGFRFAFDGYVAYTVLLGRVGVPARIMNILRKKEVRTLRQLANMTEEQFLSYEGLSESSLETARKVLEDYDMWFRNSEPKCWPLDTKIEDCNFSIRSRKIFKDYRINNLGEIAMMTDRQLLAHKLCGQATVAEIKRKLNSFGLKLKED